MKKILTILAIMIATALLFSCAKTDSIDKGEGVSASIVGGWEFVSVTNTFYDKDGKTVSVRDVLVTMYKSQGVTDEQIASMSSIIDEAAASIENDNVLAGKARYYFESNGTLKSSGYADNKWTDPAVTGTYTLQGDKLTLKINETNDTVVAMEYTVLTLNSTELKFTGTTGDLGVYKQLGFTLKVTSVLKRL